MHVVRFAEAPAYSAPGHHDMQMVRLQGREAGPSSDAWVGVSVIAPGGGTTLSASPQEKMYVVLDGELWISNGETEIALGAGILAASRPTSNAAWRTEPRYRQPFFW